MPTAGGALPVVLRFRPRAPLDPGLTLAPYARWGEDPATPYRDGQLYRVARMGGRLVPYRLAVRGPVTRPRATVAFWGPDTPAARRTVRAEAGRLLGEPFDVAGFVAGVAGHPVLGPLVAPAGGLVGLRPTAVPDPFEMLVGVISAQQVHLALAFQTRARLVRRLGVPVRVDDVIVHRFPEATALAATTPRTLRALRYSTRKAEYIVGLAREIATGRLDLAALTAAPDDEVIERLTGVRGLGRWTAEWFLARGLGRPDVCPADDLGVRRAVEALCLGGRPADAARVRRLARGWRPHRTLAVHYLLGAHRARARGR